MPITLLTPIGLDQQSHTYEPQLTVPYMKHEKLHALMLRAIHQSTPEEEARTCALIFCKNLYANMQARESAGPSRAAPKPAPAPPPPSARVIVSKYAGCCRTCGKTYAIGQRIQWMKGKGAWHTTCRAPE